MNRCLKGCIGILALVICIGVFVWNRPTEKATEKPEMQIQTEETNVPISADRSSERTDAAFVAAESLEDILLQSVYDESAESVCSHKETVAETQEATCSTPGCRRNRCKDCGELVSTEFLPPLGHSYSEKTIMDARSDNSVTTEYTCVRCGESYTESFRAAGERTAKAEIGETPEDEL